MIDGVVMRACVTPASRQASDLQGHNYTFNVCGQSPFRCLPSWMTPPPLTYGVAVQVVQSHMPPGPSWVSCAAVEARAGTTVNLIWHSWFAVRVR